jgi:putative transposase
VDARAWLRAYATKHPCHGFRRAWAALRHDEGQMINLKKVHRLWREEGLQAAANSMRDLAVRESHWIGCARPGAE